MSRLLHRAGFKAVVVTKGVEVFAQAQASKPAVILLDVQMPDQDGFTTARQLKGHPDTAGIPLMFLTGRSTVDDRLAGLRIGADDYVSKSVDPRELVLRVQKLCDRLAAPQASAAAAGAGPVGDRCEPAAGGPSSAPRSPNRPWLTRDAFRERARDLAMRTWGALVIVRAPSESVPVGQWLAEQLRRRDLVGETDGGEWTLFLPEETSSGLAPRLTNLLESAQADHRRAGRRRAGRLDLARRLVRDPVRARGPGAGARAVARAAARRVLARRGGRRQPDGAPHRRQSRGDAHHRRTRAGRGYRTSLAFDGEAALQAVREQKPDAIVLDLMLPKRTGFDVLAELRQMPAPRPSVLVLSARGREEDVTRAFALGADDY